MKTILAIIVAFIAAAATLSLITFDTFTSAAAKQQNFIAELKSEMVVPPVTSNATGVV